MHKQSNEKDVAQRIQDSDLPERYKTQILRNVRNLTNWDANQVYHYEIRDTEFNEKVCIPRGKFTDGGCCEIDWTAHGAYRSELRDRNPEEVNRDICNVMLDDDIEENQKDQIRFKGKTGPIVIDYDQTKNPVKVEVITTYPKMASIMLRVFRKSLKP